MSVKGYMQSRGIGKGTVIFFGIGFALIFLTFGSVIFNAIFGLYTTNDEVVTLTVGKNQTIGTVAGKLEFEEVISSDKFIIYSRIFTDWSEDKKVFEGTYVIPPKIHVKDLLKILKLREFEWPDEKKGA